MRFILLLALTILPMHAFAADAIGTAAYVHGSVTVERKGADAVEIHEGDKVFLGDTLRTDEGDFVEVKFLDETSIELTGMDGSLTINEYLYDPKKPENNKAHYGVLKGSFKYVSGLLPKSSDDVKIDLDFGSIGVRGTTVYRAMKDMECWIFLEDGEIDVSNTAGSVSLKPGDGTRIHALDVAPHEVKPWGQKNIDWIKNEVAKPE